MAIDPLSAARAYQQAARATQAEHQFAHVFHRRHAVGEHVVVVDAQIELRAEMCAGFLAQGAVMGDSWGLETPLWFAPKGVAQEDIFSFRRSNDFPHVKAECKGVREKVGVTEIANFAKYEFTGAGAEAYLARLMTNVMPKTGRLVLTPMLNEKGKLIGDFTIAKAGEGHFYMWGSSQAQIYHMRWFEHGPVGLITSLFKKRDERA